MLDRQTDTQIPRRRESNGRYISQIPIRPQYVPSILCFVDSLHQIFIVVLAIASVPLYFFCLFISFDTGEAGIMLPLFCGSTSHTIKNQNLDGGTKSFLFPDRESDRMAPCQLYHNPFDTRYFPLDVCPITHGMITT